MECFFQEKIYLCIRFATIAQLVEHWLPKPRVAGSSPVYRSKTKRLEYQWFNTNNKPIKSTKNPINPYPVSVLFSTFCLKWQKKMGRKLGVKIKHYGNNKSNGKKVP